VGQADAGPLQHPGVPQGLPQHGLDPRLAVALAGLVGRAEPHELEHPESDSDEQPDGDRGVRDRDRGRDDLDDSHGGLSTCCLNDSAVFPITIHVTRQ
jgi:hypothetical protein